MKLLGLFMALLALTVAVGAEGFVHPGLLHTRADLTRMRAAIATQTQPTFAGWEIFAAHPSSQPAYAMQGPAAEIGRNPNLHSAAYDADANAAYQNALRWCLTGDRAAAAKAIAIIDAWSATLHTVSGRDAVLMAGLGPFKMVNAAELLRHTDAGWLAADIAHTERSFREIIYPTLQNFAPFANGNWDTAAIKTILAIGVFCDDRAIYERALRYYVAGPGDGRLTHYIINAAGQCQESGRDQAHTQLGLAHLGDACEIAWHQGLDLYAYADHRLLAGFEYTARYNLGEEVPFTPTLDRTGKYHHTAISKTGRGNLRPIYEQILNHYVARQHLAAPFTARAVAKIRPEGPARPGADHTGFGTLLYAGDTKPAPALPVAPAALRAHDTGAGIALTWIAPHAAETYTLTRAEYPAGPTTVLADHVPIPAYTDATAQRGHLYTYAVSATNPLGTSAYSAPATFAAGLPPPWQTSDVGPVTLAGHSAYDGNVFTLEGAGSKRWADDAFHFASLPFHGDGTVIARFVSPLSSQLSRVGLALQTATKDHTAQIALILAPETKGEVEQPRWSVRLISYTATGVEPVELGRSSPLAAPQAIHGRLLAPLWFRLTRTGNVITGAISLDGVAWQSIATANLALPPSLFAGLIANSGLPDIRTTVTFDHVTAPGWP